jgi:L-ascorbate metabolism protein UlaG (beta-lactamase superfamily)
VKFGDIDIQFLGHAGFMISYKGKIIVIDPYHVSDKVSKADIILVSHGHSDHCSIKDVQKISRKGTVVLCPVDCQSTLIKIKNIDLNIVEHSDILDLGYAKIEFVPAYTFQGRHKKQEGWLGFVIKFGNRIVYFAGDTDKIPEMQKLSGYGKNGNNFVVILPVAGENVMGFSEAFDCVKFLNPDLAIPMSYGAGVYGTEKDARLFVDLCKQNGFNAIMLDKLN